MIHRVVKFALEQRFLVMVLVVAVLVINFVVDLAYAALDPRVRLS